MRRGHVLHRRYGHALAPDVRDALDGALRRYGARLTADDHIAKGEKVLGVAVETQKGRVRVVGAGQTLASFPASRAAQGISSFVEKFWFWQPGGSS